MYIIRPMRADDLSGLLELLKDSGHGLTSLPQDEKILKKKIAHSSKSFLHTNEKPMGELYLFAMEEYETKRLVGVSGIISKIGGFEAYYFYRVQTDRMYSRMLDKEKFIKSLHMEKTHSGPAEICSLFLSPKFRNSQNGRFLSLSRFLFMAEHPENFERKVIAEMRGQVNQKGESPFWDAVGNKYMEIDFIHADYLTLKSKSFIEELLPKYPILVDLLPKDAQDVIAEVHPDTRGARHILEKEGFRFKGQVGIFEPGPVLEARTKNVRAIKDSRVLTVDKYTNFSDELRPENTFLIANTKKNEDFKVTYGHLSIEHNKVQISEAIAKAIGVKIGDTVRFISLKGPETNTILEI